MIKFATAIGAFTLSLFGYSQQGKDTLGLKVDTTELQNLRYFDSDLNQKYADEAFNYARKDGEAKNFLAQFLNWIFKGIQRVFGVDISPEMLQIMEYIIYLLMGVVALYLLMKFILGENLSSLFSKKAIPLADLHLSEERIEHLDLEALILSALRQQNYRLAIRYHYLKVLQLLAQKNVIEWHYEKTNLDYQNEIVHTALKPLFIEASYLYDYIWYGEQEIDETQYRMAQSRFVDLNNALANNRG